MNVETGRAVVLSWSNYDLPGIPLAFYGSGRRLDSRGLFTNIYSCRSDSPAFIIGPEEGTRKTPGLRALLVW